MMDSSVIFLAVSSISSIGGIKTKSRKTERSAWTETFLWKWNIKPRTNGHNIVGCYILRSFAQPVACCWVLLGVVAQSLEPTTPNISVVSCSPKRCATMLDPFAQLSNIFGATHAHYKRCPTSYGLYPSHDAMQAATLLGYVASVCTPLRPTWTKQLPTFLAQ